MYVVSQVNVQEVWTVSSPCDRGGGLQMPIDLSLYKDEGPRAMEEEYDQERVLYCKAILRRKGFGR